MFCRVTASHAKDLVIDSRRPHNWWDCNPAPGGQGQGYWDGAGYPSLYSLVVLEMATCTLAFEAEWSRVFKIQLS